MRPAHHFQIKANQQVLLFIGLLMLPMYTVLPTFLKNLFTQTIHIFRIISESTNGVIRGPVSLFFIETAHFFLKTPAPICLYLIQRPLQISLLMDRV